MIMTSFETTTNAITNSNLSKITAAITLQITFENGRCHGDILRKHVNIIRHVDGIFGTPEISILIVLTIRGKELFFLRISG